MRFHRSLLLLFLFSTPLFAAPMSRVVAVIGPQTVAVENNGSITSVTLSGIEITDPHNAVALLSWTVNGAWVLVENGLIYRSPDGLLVNRELVARGFARATAPETTVLGRNRGVYLGESAPGRTAPSTRASRPSPRATQTRPAQRPTRKPAPLMPRLTKKPK